MYRPNEIIRTTLGVRSGKDGCIPIGTKGIIVRADGTNAYLCKFILPKKDGETTRKVILMSVLENIIMPLQERSL